MRSNNLVVPPLGEQRCSEWADNNLNLFLHHCGRSLLNKTLSCVGGLVGGWPWWVLAAGEKKSQDIYSKGCMRERAQRAAGCSGEALHCVMSGLHMSWGWEGSRSCCPEVKTIISLDLIISLINPAIWILSNTLHSSENRWKVQCRMDRGVNQPLTAQWLLDLLRVTRSRKRKGKRTAARGSEVSIWGHRLFRGGAPVKKHCGKTQERVNKGGTQVGSLLVFVIFSFPTFYDYFW